MSDTFDDAVFDGIATATKIAKKPVYRVGDIVRIINPRFIERVGYPLVWPMLMDEFEAKLPQVRAAMHALVMPTTDEARISDLRFKQEVTATDKELLKGVCMAAVRLRNFGGNERSLHYFTDEKYGDYLKGQQVTVDNKRIVKTGTRFMSRSSYSYEGEYDDFELGGLYNEKTHVLLTVNYLEIEACDVELVKAAEAMYYIRNTRSVVGNSALWWADGGHGYTCDLKKAWKVPETKARSICSDRPEQDYMIKATDVEKLVEHHVDSQLLFSKRRKKCR